MYETRKEREETYDKYAAILNNLVSTSDAHYAAEPDCGAGPLCIDGRTMAHLDAICVLQSDYAVLMISVAVREMSRLRKRLAGMAGRLEVQRGITASLASAVDDADRREEALNDEIQMLLATIDQAAHAESVIEP